MSETKKQIRLSQAIKEFNLGKETIVEHLEKNGFEVENKPTFKLSQEMYSLLIKDFAKDKEIKERAKEIELGIKKDEAQQESAAQATQSPDETILIKNISSEEPVKPDTPAKDETEDVKETQAKEEPKAEQPKQAEEPAVEEKKADKPSDEHKIDGPKVLGSINLPSKKKKAEKKPEPKKEEPKKAAPKKEEPKKAEKKPEPKKEEPKKAAPKKEEPKAAEPKKEEAKPIENTKIETQYRSIDGPKILGKVNIEPKKKKEKPKPAASSNQSGERRKRKRIDATSNKSGPPQPRSGPNTRGNSRPNTRSGGSNTGNRRNAEPREITDKEIKDKLKATKAKIDGQNKKSNRRDFKKKKRDKHREIRENEAAQQVDKTLKVTEFITVAELANMMNITPTEIIKVCFSLGMMVTQNQRLEQETLELVAEEFEFEVEFVDANADIEEEVIEDAEEDLIPRPPIVTIMGHVDHGKTSLLDYIRSANVVAGEAGGITQHIGAYEVTIASGEQITFLDTPGHEAFTAMRARGTKVTDIAVIVIAADDAIMPQTKEAIAHAQAANVPMIFAFNKIDKPGADADRIRTQLSEMNILVEDWGGKFQAQEISAKKGLQIDDLLEKIVLESEILELKANPDREAQGTIIEASLDKGKGYVASFLIQTGTLKIGDMIVSGAHYGKVKAMFDERGNRVEVAGPSTPVQILGLSGAPTAGEQFKVYTDESKAKEVANKRSQLQREQSERAQKRLTLDEIGKRIQIGNFQELNLIVKGDVDGSVEALTDSLLKLSTPEIQVNVIHKGVGQVSESDVLLATASDALIIGFQVRPSGSARALAEKEEIEIRSYSIIYAAIEEIKSAMEGMLKPKEEEKVTANIEIRETFKISKVGTIAGAYVVDGNVNRNNQIRVVRDGVVVYTGKLASLKRFKDDVREVKAGYECGISVENYNNIQVGDIIECFEMVEIKRTLDDN